MRGAVGEVDVLGDASKRDMCRGLTRKVISEREAWRGEQSLFPRLIVTVIALFSLGAVSP